jgi:hypothetical protein
MRISIALDAPAIFAAPDPAAAVIGPFRRLARRWSSGSRSDAPIPAFGALDFNPYQFLVETSDCLPAQAT